MSAQNGMDTKVGPLRSTVGQALMRAKSAFTGIGVFSFFINLLMLTGPLYMLQVYDRVLLSGSVETLIGLTVLMAMMFTFMGILDWIRARVMARIADDFSAHLGPKTFREWLRAGPRSAAPSQPVSDLATLRQFLSGNAPATFFDIPWAPIFIAVIFFLHPMLGWLAVFGALVLTCVAIYNELSTREPTMDALALQRAERNLSSQAIRNADVISAMGMGDKIAARWKDMNMTATQESLLSTDRRGSATSFTKAFRMFIQSAILGLGGYYAIKGVITPGAMIAGSIIMGRAMAPVQMAISQWRGVLSARDAFRRLNEFYDSVPEDEDTTGLPTPQGALSVEGVTAGPPGAQSAILHSLNFNIAPGGGVGIIGPSASGKSTLGKLLTGIWLPQRGSVRLDGATFDQYDEGALFGAVGYLPQSVELFDGTLRDNIARFDEAATDEAVVAAAKMAGVHEMVLGLEGGYSAKLGAGGTILSGGQVQRIALARAVYGTPKLVVLDEPNANLDEAGDEALSSCIRALRAAGSSVIVIAHRRSAIIHLEHLLVLDQGRQTAFGPINEVLADMKAKRAGTPTPANQTRPMTVPSKPKIVSTKGRRTGGAVTKGGPSIAFRAPKGDAS